MKLNRLPAKAQARLIWCVLLGLSPMAGASVGVLEAAVGLERQLQNGGSASQDFLLPLTGSAVVLAGAASIETIAPAQCRRTLELVHNQPYERRGLRITSLSRRSVQNGPCSNFADALSAQAEASAQSIAEQIGLAPVTADATPGERVLVAQVGGAKLARLSEPTAAAAAGAAVALTVREKAIIRDAPSRNGEKLSRADAGTPLQARRISGNPDWFVLDGGLRYISASVVDVSDTASQPAPARGDTRRVQVRVVERAVVRNAPSFSGKKVASLAAGVERLVRKVPGMQGWLELTDSESRYPLYIHESVVDQKAADKRL